MKCPVCGAWTSVIETRTRKDGTKRRRYVCANEHRFTTQEALIDFRGRSSTDMADVQEARGPHPSSTPPLTVTNLLEH